MYGCKSVKEAETIIKQIYKNGIWYSQMIFYSTGHIEIQPPEFKSCIWSLSTFQLCPFLGIMYVWKIAKEARPRIKQTYNKTNMLFLDDFLLNQPQWNWTAIAQIAC